MKNFNLTSLLKRGKYSFYSIIIDKIVFFLLFVYFARKFAEDNYGYIITIFAVVNIISAFLEFGFGSYFQREVSKENQKVYDEVRLAIYFRFCLLFLFILLPFAYFTFLSNVNYFYIIFIPIAIFIFGTNNIFTRILYGRNKFKDVFLSALTSKGILLIVIFIGFITELNPNYLFPFLILTGIVQYIYIRMVIPDFKLNSINLTTTSFKNLLNILKISFPMGLGGFFVLIYDKIDIVLVQNIIGYKEVAIYSIAYSFYKFPQLISSSILIPAFSDLSYFFRINNRINIVLIRKIGFILLFVSFLIIMIFNSSSEHFLPFIYGESYSDSAKILNILVFALPGLFLNNLTGVILNSMNKQNQAMYTAGLGLVINIVFNLIFLEQIGLVAAAISMIITEYSVFSIQLYYIIRYENE